MRVAIVRFGVKLGQEQRNAELVRAVYAELSELDPGGFKRELPERCEWGPERSPSEVVGSYRLLD